MNYTTAIILIIVSVLIMVFTLIGVCVWFFVFFRFKHTVELISLHNNTEKIRVKKAIDAELKDTGAKIWRLRWCRDVKYIPVPPNNVIKITDKGKNFVRCYVTETGDIIFSDSQHPKLIPHFNEILKDIPDYIEHIPDIKERQRMYDQWKRTEMERIKKEAGENYIIFKPYTTNHRVMQVLQVQKAAQRRKKSAADRLQMVLNLLPMIVLAFIIVLGIIFWQDLAQPMLDKQGEITAQKQADLEQWRIIQQISQDVQHIKTEVGEIDKSGSEAPY